MTSLEESPSPLLVEVIQPIAGSQPTGEDASYNDDFLWLKAEIDRTSSVDAGSVDYAQIIEKSQAILGHVSKDLRVVSYLGLGLFQTNGFGGLYEGLAASLALVERYWDDLYPPLRRMPARRNALQFLAERLTEGLESQVPVLADRQPIEEAIEVLKKLQEFTMRVMDDQAPLLSGLRKALEDALRRAPDKPAPLPEAQENAEDSAAGKPDGSAAGSERGGGPPTTEDEVLLTVGQAADFLREQDPARPAAYRLSRSLLWGLVEEKPVNDNGMTPFMAPEEHRRLYLNTLASSQNWTELLSEAEALFQEPPYHFWMDLQRFSFEALDGLGYASARDAVAEDTAAFTRRLMSIEKLKFGDGTPFADPATQVWMESITVTQAQQSPGSSKGGVRSKLEESVQEAKTRLAQGDLAEAFACVQLAPLRGGSARERFQQRLYLAELCLLAAEPALAMPLLEQLTAEAARFSLDEWEPQWTVEVWGKLYACCSQLAAEPSQPEQEAVRLYRRSMEAFDQVCRLDLALALELRPQ